MKLWLIGLALLCACATGRVTVPVLRPAEINLAQYRTLGISDFSGGQPARLVTSQLEEQFGVLTSGQPASAS